MLQSLLLALVLAQTPQSPLLVLPLAESAGAFQVVVAGPADSVGWDYVDADLTAGLVDSFSLILDAQAPVKLTVAAAKMATQPTGNPAGTTSYVWKLPAMTIGAHTVTVQACNAGTCSGAASLAFTMVIVPKTPSNFRPVKGA